MNKYTKAINNIGKEGVRILEGIHIKNPLNKYYRKSADYIKKIVDKYLD